jgi:CRISPR system Cascade subunit CasC
LPALVSVVLREDQPVNLVSAFEQPVQPVPQEAGIVAESVQRLVAEMGRTSDLWGLTPVAVWSTYSPGPDATRNAAAQDALGAPLPFKDVVSAATGSVQRRLASADA